MRLCLPPTKECRNERMTQALPRSTIVLPRRSTDAGLAEPGRDLNEKEIA